MGWYRKAIAQSEAQGVEYELEAMAQTHTNLGHALLTLAQTGRKDLEDPEVHYRAALRYDGRFVHAYTGLAEVLEAKGKKEASRQVLEEAILLFPQHAGLYGNLGVTLQHAGLNARAREILLVATKLDPAVAQNYDNLAVTFNALEDEHKRPSDLQEAFPNPIPHPAP